MKIVSNMILCATCVAVLCVGCQSAKPVESAVSIDDAVAGLVPQLVQKALASQCFAKGKPPVMVVGRIKNDTMSILGGNLDFMKSQMVEMFSDSGQVVISSALGDVAEDRIPLSAGSKILAPSLALNGKLTQRDSLMKDGRKQREFTLELSIVELATGNRIWYGKSVVCVVCDGRIAHCEESVAKFSQCV